jgi:uncharacterized membrane protein
MGSKANFKTHPIHPMLVAFPIAFRVEVADGEVRRSLSS